VRSIALAVVFSIVALAAPAIAQPPSSSAADAFPDGAGKAATLRICSACHPPEGVVETLRTRQQWSDVIDQMAQFGAQASDQEFEEILAYLVKFYSPIRINTEIGRAHV